MARRAIFADDLTDTEITGDVYGVTVKLSVVKLDAQGNPEDGQTPTDYDAEWELSTNSTAAVTALVENADLVDFMLRLRNAVSLAVADSATIRAWAMKEHPEFKVPERGRIPVEVTAAYRREVIAKMDAPDAK